VHNFFPATATEQVQQGFVSAFSVSCPPSLIANASRNHSYICRDLSLQMNEYELTAAVDKLLYTTVFTKTVFHWKNKYLMSL